MAATMTEFTKEEQRMLMTRAFNTPSSVQSLDDGIDLAEALYVYGLMMACVFAFCSLGTELSEQVRRNCPTLSANVTLEPGSDIHRVITRLAVAG
jgi:hypothetical protein